MITDIEDFFTKGCGRCDRFDTLECSTRKWDIGLSELRRICRESGMVETVKWGHPCYMHAGRNIVIIGAHRNDFRISFFNAALMKNPDAVLEKQGPNANHADTIRFVDNSQVAAMEPILRACLTEAMGYAEAGLKPPKAEREYELPNELVDALDCDPELSEAFFRLTPGRQKSYVINLSGAKTSATRSARVAKFYDKILAGKGATDR